MIEVNGAVSIHAPTWGATRKTPQTPNGNLFQSTHPHGVRQSLFLSKDATCLFQSTHPHGVRQKLQNRNKYQYEFQSTHPHGVRLSRWILIHERLSFNPRTHMGCDRFLPSVLLLLYSFNPRTHMGCDSFPSLRGWLITVSIPAPTWGATC